MKRLVFSVAIAIVAVGAATSVLRSHSLFPFGKHGMPSIQELQSTNAAGKLPAQDFEDRSLVFPRESTR